MVMVVTTITVEIENLFLLSGDFYYFLRNGKALEKEASQKPSLIVFRERDTLKNL